MSLELAHHERMRFANKSEAFTCGLLMVDDYSGYKALFKTGIVELACFAHARHKFFDYHQANLSPAAAQALHRIAELCAIERRAQQMDSSRRTQSEELPIDNNTYGK